MLYLFYTLYLSLSAYSADTLIVILGDSLTEGYGVTREQAYPALVEKMLLEQKKSVKIINSGISGSTSASCKSRAQWSLKTKPSVFVIALGANDALRGLNPQETYKNITTCIEYVKSQKIKVALMGMQAPPNYGKAFTREYNQIFTKIDKEQKIPYLPFFISEVAGKKEYNQGDGIHPNVAGHELIAKKILPFIKGLL